MVGPIECWGRSLVVVTGASKGLGAAICTSISAKLAGGSVIIGTGRDLPGLTHTQTLAQNSNVKLLFHALDLAHDDPDNLRHILLQATADGQKTFDRVIVVHNAGSLGELNYLREVDHSERVQQYLKINVGSVITLNAYLLKFARVSLPNSKLHVMNISSLAAVQPIKSWGLYCTGKAARDMLFKVLAEEEKDIDVLNYAPGPLQGNMQIEARTHTQDPEVKEAFSNMNAEGKLIAPAESANKMLTLIESGKYQSGDHVDFYDI